MILGLFSTTTSLYYGIRSQIYPYGTALWQLDVATGNSHKVELIDEWHNYSDTGYGFYPFGDKIFIFAQSADISPLWALWITDGTPEGARLLYRCSGQLCFNNNATGPEQLIFKGRLYFHDHTMSGIQLWASDGTVAGTTVAVPSFPALPYYELVHTESQMFFNGDDGYYGDELWITDGTTAGTHVTRDIVSAYPNNPPIIAGRGETKLYYVPHEGKPGRYRLWMSDGTANGTGTVPNSLLCGQGSSQLFATVGDVIYYSDQAGCDLWRTDGTEAGIWKVWTRPTEGYTKYAPYYLTPIGDRLFFIHNQGQAGTFLWMTDDRPDSPGSVKLKQIFPYSEDTQIYFPPVAINNALFFMTHTRDINSTHGLYGWKLWKSDGTPEGTQEVYSSTYMDTACQSLGGVSTTFFMAAGNRLFFTACHPTQGYTFWQSDGDSASTHPVENAVRHGLSQVAEMDGTLYLVDMFSKGSNISSPRIYKTRGSDQGGVQLVYQFPDYYASGSAIQSTASMNHLLYFSYHPGGDWNYLWISNGTSGGTKPVMKNSKQVYGDGIYSVNDQIFFRGYDKNAGYEPWISDGTADGTFLLADVYPDVYSSFSENFSGVGDQVFFTATDGAHGYQLFAYKDLDYPYQVMIPMTRR